jgi:hypothetical protein
VTSSDFSKETLSRLVRRHSVIASASSTSETVRRSGLGPWFLGSRTRASGIYLAYQRAVQAEARLAVQRDAALVSEKRAITATREAARERDKVAEANASLQSLADRQRRTLYDSSMILAQSAWESGAARRALELLRQWIPTPGEKDLRGFEWHYWNRLAHQEKRIVRLEGLTPEDRAMSLVGAVSRDGTRVADPVSDRNRYGWTMRQELDPDRFASPAHDDELIAVHEAFHKPRRMGDRTPS